MFGGECNCGQGGTCTCRQGSSQEGGCQCGMPGGACTCGMFHVWGFYEADIVMQGLNPVKSILVQVSELKGM